MLELLDRFAEAWNRHDLDALMSMMTDDSVFESSLVLRRMDSGATEGGGPRRVRRITNDSGRLVAEMEVADAQVGMIAAESIRQPRHPDQRGAALREGTLAQRGRLQRMLFQPRFQLRI